jgi:hypothetical protein
MHRSLRALICIAHVAREIVLEPTHSCVFEFLSLTCAKVAWWSWAGRRALFRAFGERRREDGLLAADTYNGRKETLIKGTRKTQLAYNQRSSLPACLGKDSEARGCPYIYMRSTACGNPRPRGCHICSYSDDISKAISQVSSSKFQLQLPFKCHSTIESLVDQHHVGSVDIRIFTQFEFTRVAGCISPM